MSAADQPAFPGFSETTGQGPCRLGPTGEWENYAPGMSIRQHFAGQLLAAMVANPEGVVSWTKAAVIACAGADALIAELNKPVTP